MACGVCLMSSTFYASKKVCLWFSSWAISSSSEYFGVVVLLITMSFVREWLSEARSLSATKRLRKVKKGLPDSSDDQPTSPGSSASASFVLQSACRDSVYYFFTLTLGYFLMLAVMSYNAGLTITVIVASVVGHFLAPFVVNRIFGQT